MYGEKNFAKNIEVVDIFCGAGGLSYGLKQAGMKILAGVDIDPAGKYAFENNTGGSFIQKDVRVLTGKEIEKLYSPNAIKMLAGCAPCQPFSSYSRSLISQKANEKNNRWNLLQEFSRLVEEIRPEILTVENVPGLKKQPIFQEFLSVLERLGYKISVYTHEKGEEFIVKCEHLGIPQTRRRLVVIASRIGDISFLPPNKGKRCTVREAIGHLPALEAKQCHIHDRLHRAQALSALNMRRIKASKPGGSWRDWPQELVTKCHKKQTGKSYGSVYGRMEWDKPAPTMTTQCFGYGNGRFGHPEQNRPISLREAAIFQSFPENYQFIAPDKKDYSMSEIGRLIGNAVPPRLAQWVGESIIASLGERL